MEKRKDRRETAVSMQKLQKKIHNGKNYSEEFKQKAIAIFYEGNNGRAVGRIMGINKSTVYNWIKKLDKKLQDVDSVEENIAVETKQAEVIEMDELFDYINEKKQSLRNIVEQLEKPHLPRFPNT